MKGFQEDVDFDGMSVTSSRTQAAVRAFRTDLRVDLSNVHDLVAACVVPSPPADLELQGEVGGGLLTPQLR